MTWDDKQMEFYFRERNFNHHMQKKKKKQSLYILSLLWFIYFPIPYLGIGLSSLKLNLKTFPKRLTFFFIIIVLISVSPFHLSIEWICNRRSSINPLYSLI